MNEFILVYERVCCGVLAGPITTKELGAALVFLLMAKMIEDLKCVGLYRIPPTPSCSSRINFHFSCHHQNQRYGHSGRRGGTLPPADGQVASGSQARLFGQNPTEEFQGGILIFDEGGEDTITTKELGTVGAVAAPFFPQVAKLLQDPKCARLDRIPPKPSCRDDQ